MSACSMVVDCFVDAATNHRAGHFSHLCSLCIFMSHSPYFPFAGGSDTPITVHCRKCMHVLAPWLFNPRPNDESRASNARVNHGKPRSVLERAGKYHKSVTTWFLFKAALETKALMLQSPAFPMWLSPHIMGYPQNE